MKNLTPPKWAPHAIATDRGWEDPKTGEIYISLRGLKTLIEQKTLSVALEIEPPIETPVENTFVDIIVSPTPKVDTEVAAGEEVSVSIEEPVKRSRGRPKKVTTGK